MINLTSEGEFKHFSQGSRVQQVGLLRAFSSALHYYPLCEGLQGKGNEEAHVGLCDIAATRAIHLCITVFKNAGSMKNM